MAYPVISSRKIGFKYILIEVFLLNVTRLLVSLFVLALRITLKPFVFFSWVSSAPEIYIYIDLPLLELIE